MNTIKNDYSFRRGANNGDDNWHEISKSSLIIKASAARTRACVDKVFRLKKLQDGKAQMQVFRRNDCTTGIYVEEVQTD